MQKKKHFFSMSKIIENFLDVLVEVILNSQLQLILKLLYLSDSFQTDKKA